jgi:hypothetical protein
MKRLSYWIASLCLLSALGTSVPAKAADVSVNLRIGDRYRGPDIYFRDQPRIAYVPGTRVYYVQDSNYDVYRYGRFWYMNDGSRWYRSRSYRGPWIYVGYRGVPREISYVPPRYRRHWRDFRDVDYRRDRNYDRRNRGRYNDDPNYRDPNNDPNYRDPNYRDPNNDPNRDWRNR